MLEALCRQSSTTLDIVHAEDGPPITQRTSGLGLRWVKLAQNGKLDPLCGSMRATIYYTHTRRLNKIFVVRTCAAM